MDDDDDGDDDSDDVENKEELGHYWHTREGKPGGDHPGSHYNTLERASRAAAQAVASPASVGDLPKQIQTKVADLQEVGAVSHQIRCESPFTSCQAVTREEMPVPLLGERKVRWLT